MTRYVWATVLAGLLAGGPCSGGEIDDVVAAITAERNKITSYHLIIVYDDRTTGANPSFRKKQYEVWRRDDKARLDSVVLASADKDERVDQREVWCRNCEKKDHMLRASHRPGALTPVTFQPLARYAPATDPTDVNWPWLGLSNNGNWPYFAYPQDRFINSFQITDPARVQPLAIANEQRDGVKCRKYTLTSVPGQPQPVRNVIWVDPARRHAPVRTERWVNGQLQSETMYTYHAEPTDKVWFPASVQHQQHGARPGTTIYTIVSAEFNRRIPDKVFQYGGLNLPNNFPVETEAGMDLMKLPVLRDGKIVPREEKSPGGDLPPPHKAVPDKLPSGWLPRIPYLLGAFVLAFAGVTLLRRMARSRKG
ncbi:MAG TPA: hypothetical protein VM597_38025 [Gemmataceae bacterium]|nr:hypothetical protein [Gemmataceae bacterium]